MKREGEHMSCRLRGRVTPNFSTKKESFQCGSLILCRNFFPIRTRSLWEYRMWFLCSLFSHWFVCTYFHLCKTILPPQQKEKRIDDKYSCFDDTTSSSFFFIDIAQKKDLCTGDNLLKANLTQKMWAFTVPVLFLKETVTSNTSFHPRWSAHSSQQQPIKNNPILLKYSGSFLRDSYLSTALDKESTHLSVWGLRVCQRLMGLSLER